MLLYSWEYANNLAFREDGNQIEPTMEKNTTVNVEQ